MLTNIPRDAIPSKRRPTSPPRGNRFWGIGITSLAARATASADVLAPAELAEGARALTERVQRFRPRVVAILGVTAYRTAFQASRASLGR
jgi:TDG/mug DNA glycosylase family protein